MRYSKIINPLTILRDKIPLFILTVQISITNIAFNECPYSNISFFIYFPLLCIFCLIYQGFHSYISYHKIQDLKKKWLLVICSSLISLISFFAVSYYVPGGKPFSCFFNYNNIISTIVFYLSFCFVYIYSYIEHHFILNKNNDEEDGIELTDRNSNDYL